MKITNLLSLLILLAPSAFALRGASQHQDSPIPQEQSDENQRALGGDNYKYVKHVGACRKNSNGTGAGSHRNEFWRYEWKHNPDVSYEWCKRKCSQKGKDCAGFEWRDAGSNSHCEIWSYKMKGWDARKADHYCYIKEYENGGGGGFDYDKDKYKHYDGGCRKRTHPRSGIDGTDYDKFKGWSFEKCERECTDDHECSGFEYFYKNGKKHCELWTTRITGWERSSYLDCFVKKG